MLQAPVPFSDSRSISYYDVFTALTVLQGRTRLIRHRLHAVPAPRQQELAATLDEIETQIGALTQQLELAQRAGLGPPF